MISDSGAIKKLHIPEGGTGMSHCGADVVSPANWSREAAARFQVSAGRDKGKTTQKARTHTNRIALVYKLNNFNTGYIEKTHI